MEEKGPCEINVLILYHGRVTVYRFMSLQVYYGYGPVMGT